MEKLVEEPNFMIRKIVTLGHFPEVTYKSPSRDVTPATHLVHSSVLTLEKWLSEACSYSTQINDS